MNLSLLLADSEVASVGVSAGTLQVLLAAAHVSRIGNHIGCPRRP